MKKNSFSPIDCSYNRQEIILIADGKEVTKSATDFFSPSLMVMEEKRTIFIFSDGEFSCAKVFADINIRNTKNIFFIGCCRAAQNNIICNEMKKEPKGYTLKRKCITSPSFTTYSLPSTFNFPLSRQAASLPYFMKSS